MILLRRSKRFSEVPQPGRTIDPDNVPIFTLDQQRQQQQKNMIDAQKQSQNLLIEQMKTQRQRAQINHAQDMMDSKESLDQQKRLAQLQKLQQQKDDQDTKSQIQIRKTEKDMNPAVRNVGYYKSKAKPGNIVGMPRQ